MPEYKAFPKIAHQKVSKNSLKPVESSQMFGEEAALNGIFNNLTIIPWASIGY